MGTRRKKPDGPADGVTTAVAAPPVEANGTHAEPTAAPESQPVGGTLSRPVKSIAVPVGDGVKIEGSIWPREVTVDGTVLTAYSATVRKCYRGEDDEVRHTTLFRGSEIPLVQYVLGCCAQWILDQRREEDPPF